MAFEKTGKITYFAAYKYGGRLRIDDYDKDFIVDSRREDFNALYSLTMAAAVNRFRIKVNADDLNSEGIHFVNAVHTYW